LLFCRWFLPDLWGCCLFWSSPCQVGAKLLSSLKPAPELFGSALSGVSRYVLSSPVCFMLGSWISESLLPPVKVLEGTLPLTCIPQRLGACKWLLLLGRITRVALNYPIWWENRMGKKEFKMWIINFKGQMGLWRSFMKAHLYLLWYR
jgi:hypothetical protein